MSDYVKDNNVIEVKSNRQTEAMLKILEAYKNKADRCSDKRKQEV